MNKWQQWYDNLDDRTKEYLKHQPIWKDSEMKSAMIGAFIVGLLIGLCF